MDDGAANLAEFGLIEYVPAFQRVLEHRDRRPRLVSRLTNAGQSWRVDEASPACMLQNYDLRMGKIGFSSLDREYAADHRFHP